MEVADYPLVKFARELGKSTADLTTMDLVKFTNKWIKEPSSIAMIQEIKKQQQRASQIGKELQLNREEDDMAKHTTTSFQKAQTSRLAEQGIESPINDGQEEIVIHEDTEVVCSMELTKADIAALLFSIDRTFADYEMIPGQPFTISLLTLKEGLEGV